MKISAKGRYAIAATLEIARQSGGIDGEFVSSVSVSKSLGISKIFLEQVLSGLKKAEIVASAKGTGGGYRLAAPPEGITVWDILLTAESGLFEKTDVTAADAPNIEAALNELVFDKLDAAVRAALKHTTLRELLDCANNQSDAQAFMPNM